MSDEPRSELAAQRQAELAAMRAKLAELGHSQLTPPRRKWPLDRRIVPILVIVTILGVVLVIVLIIAGVGGGAGIVR